MRDANLIFSDEQALTATAASTNIVKVPSKKIVNDLYLEVVVQTALAATGGAAELVIALQAHDDASFGAQTAVLTSASIAKASLTANTVVYVAKLPPIALEGYLRVYYTVSTNNFTSGTISAHLTDAPVIEA